MNRGFLYVVRRHKFALIWICCRLTMQCYRWSPASPPNNCAAIININIITSSSRRRSSNHRVQPILQQQQQRTSLPPARRPRMRPSHLKLATSMLAPVWKVSAAICTVWCPVMCSHHHRRLLPTTATATTAPPTTTTPMPMP